MWFYSCEILARFGCPLHIMRKNTGPASLVAYYFCLQGNHEWTLANSWECGLQKVFYVSNWWFCYIHLKQWTMLDWLWACFTQTSRLMMCTWFHCWGPCFLVAKAGCKAEGVYVTDPTKTLGPWNSFGLPWADISHTSRSSQLEKEHAFVASDKEALLEPSAGPV